MRKRAPGVPKEPPAKTPREHEHTPGDRPPRKPVARKPVARKPVARKARGKIPPKPRYDVEPGEPFPAGATPNVGGVNFSIFSREATSVELLLFEAHDSPRPFQTVHLDLKRNRSFFFWHVFVQGLKPGVAYAFRIDGPKDRHGKGQRYDPEKVLLDPWTLGQTHALWDKDAAASEGDNVTTAMRGLVIDPRYDWEGDRPLVIPDEDVVIYEMHVGGFTRSPSSGVAHPGTFSGVTEKIPYLKDLGINAVELLPVMAFDPQSVPQGCPTKTNFWGYNTVSFFSPHPDYCVTPERGTHLDEFRDMVKALHRSGIAVILDVVFNHTAEASHDGPTINFRGCCNEFFYHLDPDDKGQYRDFTGCGNTLNSNHPFVTQFIVSCLEFWVNEMHVDGFRFDLASALARGEDAEPMYHAPVLWAIEFSRSMLRTKIIAEAWDATGLYQVGYFPGYRWKEWNGLFRDDLRRFLRGDAGLVGRVAARITGSRDLYGDDGRLPTNSINFITAHDGFTLNDLVTYDSKHNEANGEENRDGHNDNLSCNCGEEGESDDVTVEAFRRRQIKNAMALLLLSQGVPMLLAGDECRRTQHGNNNAYCQDNPIGWFDWTLPERHADIFRFTQEMIAFRRRHPCLRRSRWIDDTRENARGFAPITWHGLHLHDPGFADGFARALAFTVGGTDEGVDLHVMINMYVEPLTFDLPPQKGRIWFRAIDTSLASPNDIVDPTREVPIETVTYTAAARSLSVLVNREPPSHARPPISGPWPDWI
ncbi:MAG: glycogen debranching protein GlgX [Deltaproteobacteria bacterium]|nr:glycogen debranching protein GlgX [Deltaproteobacteria bacterium]